MRVRGPQFYFFVPDASRSFKRLMRDCNLLDELYHHIMAVSIFLEFSSKIKNILRHLASSQGMPLNTLCHCAKRTAILLLRPVFLKPAPLCLRSFHANRRELFTQYVTQVTCGMASEHNVIFRTLQLPNSKIIS